MKLKKYDYFIGNNFLKLKETFKKNNMNFYETEEEFLNEFRKLENCSEKYINYYLVDDNNCVCAQGGITVNPDEWDLKYLGNFSYQVLRNERGKGYGRQILDYLLKEALQTYNMKEGHITCDDRNYKSASVIEYNGGVLECLKVINYPKEQKDALPPEFDRYYYIDIIKSINNKNENYRSYNDSKMECKVLEENLTVIPAIEEASNLNSPYKINSLSDIKKIYIDILKKYQNSDGDVRNLKQIIETKTYNNEYELLTLLSFHIRKNNIPTLLCITKNDNKFKPLLQMNLENKKYYIESNFNIYETLPPEIKIIKKTISVLSSNNYQNMLDYTSSTPNLDAFIERLKKIDSYDKTLQ